MKPSTWVFIILVAAGLGYYEYVVNQPTTVKQAVEKKYVTMTLQASNASEVTATFTRTSDAPGTLSMTIASGTIITNADPGSQLLMTARTVTVVLSEANPTVETRIETYCLNQFLLEPTLKSSLAIDLDGTAGSSSAVETEPVRKLVQDLEQSGKFRFGEAHGARQVAVWMIAGGYQDLTYEEVRQKIRQQFLVSVEKQMTEGQDKARATLHENMPTLTSEELNATLQRYRETRWSTDRDGETDRLTQQVLNDFVSNGAQMLKIHDPKIDESPFFMDVRVRGLTVKNTQ